MTRIDYNGMTFSDENDQIVSGEVYNAVSLVSDVIEVGTFKAEIRVHSDADGEKLRNFKRNDKLICFNDNRQLGVWYVDNVERTSKYTYCISANNAVSLLDGSKHYGGIYTGETAVEIIADICTIPYYVNPTMAFQKLYGWLPAASRRSNLAQVLFAIGASAWVDETGLLRIGPLWDGVSNYIGEDSIMTGDKVKYASKITEVSVLEHQYTQGYEDVTLFDGTSQDGDIITFQEPAHSLTASGVTILDSGANYVKLSAGSGTVTGKKYIHTTRDIRLPVSESDVESVKEVKSATLVSLTNSVAVAQRLAAYYKCCETVQHNAVFHNQEPGDVISFDHPFDGDVVGCIKSISLQIGVQKIVSEQKIVSGFLPPQPSNLEYYDARAVLSGEGDWKPPEGAAKGTAVLIGGAQGGWSGHKGNPGESRGATYSTNSGSGIMSSKGGDGGEPGAPGKGGKVLVVDIDIQPGGTYHYCSGVGGPGGVHSATESVEGSYGTPSTFGPYSSDDGASMDNGYLDVITGEKFAVSGDLGIKGGKGGGVKNGATVGDAEINESGESVIDESGNTWTPGAISQPPIPTSSCDATSRDGTYLGWVAAGAGDGLGGGAAAGGNGSDGEAGYKRIKVTTGTEWTYNLYATGGTGGTGGNAAPPAKTPGNIGKGGRGGNGGGGGGGFGIAECSADNAVGQSIPNNMYLSQGTPGEGGNGSDGGQGGDGCIIVYYRIPKTIKSGSVTDKTGRFVLDRTGRLMVV